MNRPTLVLLGSTGFVGRALLERLSTEYEVTAIGRTGARDLSDRVAGVKPVAVVNAAALATIADCEADPVAAKSANVDLPATLARAAGPDLRLIHLSTDQVFDGKKGHYREGDPAHPISEYGRTKLEGERSVLSEGGNAVILRINLVCGRAIGEGLSMVDRMIAAARAGREVPLFTDEYRSPVALADVVDAVSDFVRLRFRGILHLGGPRLSRFELGQAILAKHGLGELSRPTLLSEYAGPPRTPDTSFDTRLAIDTLGRSHRDLEGILEEC